MQHTTQIANGTSYHGYTVKTTLGLLKAVMGEPSSNSGDGKVQYEWTMETDAGDVFTVYDWKEDIKIKDDTKIEWHIGAHDKFVSRIAAKELEIAIDNIYENL